MARRPSRAPAENFKGSWSAARDRRLRRVRTEVSLAQPGHRRPRGRRPASSTMTAGLLVVRCVPSGPQLPRGESGSGGVDPTERAKGLRLWRREVVRLSVPHGQEARGMPTRDPFLRVRASSRRAPRAGSTSRSGMPSLRKGSRRPHHRPSAQLSAWPWAHHLWLTAPRLQDGSEPPTTLARRRCP